jgi:hypothetical protein
VEGREKKQGVYHLWRESSGSLYGTFRTAIASCPDPITPPHAFFKTIPYSTTHPFTDHEIYVIDHISGTGKK